MMVFQSRSNRITLSNVNGLSVAVVLWAKEEIDTCLDELFSLPHFRINCTRENHCLSAPVGTLYNTEPIWITVCNENFKGEWFLITHRLGLNQRYSTRKGREGIIFVDCVQLVLF
jgi:hypothetical protein